MKYRIREGSSRRAEALSKYTVRPEPRPPAFDHRVERMHTVAGLTFVTTSSVERAVAPVRPTGTLRLHFLRNLRIWPALMPRPKLSACSVERVFMLTMAMTLAYLSSMGPPLLPGLTLASTMTSYS